MQTLTIHNPSELQDVLDGIADDFRDIDYGEYLAHELDLLADLEKSYFDSSTGPDGQPWKPNAPSTIRQKGHSVILRGEMGRRPVNIKPTKGRPGVKFPHAWATVSQFRLARSLTLKSHQSFDDAIREVVTTEGGGTLRFGSDVPYSVYNDDRPHIGMTEKYVDGAAERVLDYSIEQLKK